MATDFPGGFDTFPNPTLTTNTDDPGFELDVVISNLGDGLESVQRKLVYENPMMYQPFDTPVGSYVPVLGGGSHTGSLTLSSNAANSSTSVRFAPIAVRGNWTFDRATFYVSTAATDANTVAGVAIYDMEGNLVLDCGDASITTTGQKDLTINQTLDVGYYILGFRAKFPTSSAGVNPTFYAQSLSLGLHIATGFNGNEFYFSPSGSLSNTTTAWPSTLPGTGLSISSSGGFEPPHTPRVSLRRSA